MAVPRRHGKRRKRLARGAVVLWTVLAGLVIWEGVAGPAQAPAMSSQESAIVLAEPAANPDFDEDDAFLTQPFLQPGTGLGQQRSSVQPTQPAPRPRFRTRGS